MPVILPDKLDFNTLADTRQPLRYLLMQFANTAHIRATICQSEGATSAASAYTKRCRDIQKLIAYAQKEGL